jgi:endonuclease III
MTNLANVTEQLAARYGATTRSDARPDPVDELVMTILSQNTSDTNTERAFSSLKSTFASWQDVIDADDSDIADAIRSGGLANQKAPRIKRVLENIVNQRGALDLTFLKHLTVDEANTWLTTLPGVGPKTAACVLLFSLDMPVMPVDTHVHRVAKRLGLIPDSATAEQAHELLGSGFDADKLYQAHMLLIRHGRETCKARKPLCGTCVLSDECPSADLYLKQGAR